MKAEKIKTRLSTPQVEKLIDYLIKKKESFTVTATGYTNTIQLRDKVIFSSEDADLNSFTFPYYNRIKKDIESTDVVIDSIPFTDIRYYSVNSFFEKINWDMPSECTLIDINSAYLTCLVNSGMITRETFDYVSKARKSDRLKAVGMLATNKTEFVYQEGKHIETNSITNKVLSNYFFYCCYCIGEVMNDIAREYGENFLFFWFDGIYLRPEADPARCIEILSQNNYLCKVEQIKNCTFESGKRTLHFYYTPEGKSVKSFNVPFNNEGHKKRLVSYITNKTKNK